MKKVQLHPCRPRGRAPTRVDDQVAQSTMADTNEDGVMRDMINEDVKEVEQGSGQAVAVGNMFDVELEDS